MSDSYTIIYRSTQTHITGNQITNDLREDMSNSGESVNNLLKIHKSDKKLIQYNRELALTKSHLYSIHTNYEKLKVRFHKLYADYHKLVDVATELTVALENSVKGQDVDVQRTLKICMKIFPDLFSQNTRETSYVSDFVKRKKEIEIIAYSSIYFSFFNVFSDSRPCYNSIILT